MTKTEVPYHVLDSSNIFQEFSEKSLLKQAAHKKQIERFYTLNTVSLSLSLLQSTP
jgi:hypothetical protein